MESGSFRPVGHQDHQLRAVDLYPGATRLSLTSRRTRKNGVEVSCYLVDDLLIDTGFAHARQILLDHLSSKRPGRIVLTHHHEDHSGACALLQREWGLEVLMRHPELRWEEGVGSLPRYRRRWFGEAEEYDARQLPDRIDTATRTLRIIDCPGHSVTQVSVYDEREGDVYCGDLYISAGAAAVMRTENPFEIIRSLRRVADLDPRRLYNGHGLILERPAKRLRLKAERIERFAERALELREQGFSNGAIQRRLFRQGRLRDLFIAFTSWGDFSRRNLLRAVFRHARSG